MRPLRRLAVVVICVLCGGIAAADVLQRGVFTIEYRDRDKHYAEQAADILDEAAVELAHRLPTGEAPIGVAVCSVAQDFRAIAGRYAEPAVAAVAIPRQGILAIKTPALAHGAPDFRGSLRHELIHILLYRNYNTDSIPRWLNEGICMSLAREHRWGAAYQLGTMYWYGRVLPVDHLDFAFLEPGQEMTFGDAYAQALSMTEFLIDHLGEEGFWAMMRDMDNDNFDTVLSRHAKLSQEELFLEWRKTLRKFAVLLSVVSGFSVFHLMVFIAVLAYLRKRRKGRQLMEEWRQEEEEPPVRLPWDYDPPDDEVFWESERD